jgi:hypothetical protein
MKLSRLLPLLPATTLSVAIGLALGGADKGREVSVSAPVENTAAVAKADMRARALALRQSSVESAGDQAALMQFFCNWAGQSPAEFVETMRAGFPTAMLDCAVRAVLERGILLRSPRLFEPLLTGCSADVQRDVVILVMGGLAGAPELPVGSAVADRMDERVRIALTAFDGAHLQAAGIMHSVRQAALHHPREMAEWLVRPEEIDLAGAAREELLAQTLESWSQQDARAAMDWLIARSNEDPSDRMDDVVVRTFAAVTRCDLALAQTLLAAQEPGSEAAALLWSPFADVMAERSPKDSALLIFQHLKPTQAPASLIGKVIAAVRAHDAPAAAALAHQFRAAGYQL